MKSTHLIEIDRKFHGSKFACFIPAMEQYGEDCFHITYMQWVDIALADELLSYKYRSPKLFMYLRRVMGFSRQQVLEYINTKYEFSVTDEDFKRMEEGLVPIAAVYWKTLEDTFYRTVDRTLRQTLPYDKPKWRYEPDGSRTRLLYIQPYATSMIANDGELECVRELLETKLLGMEYAKAWQACIDGYLTIPENRRNVDKMFRLES